MDIRAFEMKDIEGVIRLWNESIGNSFLYKPFTKEGFMEKFLNNLDFDIHGSFVALNQGEVIGFASSIYKKQLLPGESFDTAPGYITMVLVKAEERRKGIGKELLSCLERYLASEGKKKIHIDFFNPINLEWIVPDTKGHDHPNSPGVDICSEAYNFFKSYGYTERTKEISLYRDLKEFQIEKSLMDKYKALVSKGITIEYYDDKKHYGLQQFFDNIKHEYWRKEIKDNLALEKPYKVLVAVDNGKICGFAGPIEIQKSGRGKFSGIGVDPSYEGRGIGKLLFFKLCQSFKSEGASFMSIFTGIDGNARRMYEAAGFAIVRQWALFKKGV